MTWFGTPLALVMPSATTILAPSEGENLCMRTILPPMTVSDRRNEWLPMTWKSGTVCGRAEDPTHTHTR